jgi:sugar lactone lactonase YvrE
MYRVSPLLDDRFELGEGPFWDPGTGRLHWVDILGCRLHGCREDGSDLRSLAVPSHLGSAAPWGDGFIAATRDGIGLLDRSGAFKPLPRSPRLAAHVRFNDGKCDPTGRFWAGTMAYDSRPGAGALYRVEPGGEVARVLDGLTLSNGLAWDLPRARMYHIDTATRRLDAYDWDAATGAIRDRRCVAAFAESDGWPDGMTLDRQGRAWIAFWDGWKVLCVDPDSGGTVAELRVPVQRPTSCAFGPGERTLFITSARTGLDAEALARQPGAGAVFQVPMPARP